MKTLNSFTARTLLVVFTSVLGSEIVRTQPAQVVEIPDPVLEAILRSALENPEGDITTEDMESLTVLNAGHRGWDVPLINSLQGLEAARNLVYLDLSGFEGWVFNPNLGTDDLSPLASLTDLRELYLEGNNLTDASVLEGLTNLTHLNLAYNQVAHLELPNEMVSLRSLNLNGNQLTTLTLPDELPSLNELDLGGNQLSALDLPESLPNLTILHLQENELKQLELPNELANLVTLSLGDNQLDTLALPEGLSNLSVLELSGNPLTDFSFLAELGNLTALEFGSSELTECCSFLEGMDSLVSLTIRDNELVAQATLPRGLSRLTTLNLRDRNLSRLILLDDLVGLTTLDLWGTHLTELSFLRHLPNLTSLDLWGMNLTSLTLPGGLNRLETLELEFNNLTHLRLPEGLVNLQRLNLRDNPLVSLEVPDDLNLEELEIDGFEKSDVTLYDPVRSNLAMARFEDRLEFTWTEGLLQSTKTIGGVWRDVADAMSPYAVQPAGAKSKVFYRLFLATQPFDAQTYFSLPRSPSEIEVALHRLARQYPAWAQVQLIGHSVVGRPIHAITIAGPSAQPPEARRHVLVIAQQHGNEPEGQVATMWIIHRLLHGFATNNTNTLIMAKVVWHFVPILNPDGWIQPMRWNVNAVDLNRNWGYNSEAPIGHTAAFSEPETRAVRDYAISLGADHLDAGIDVHMGPSSFVAYANSSRLFVERIALAMKAVRGVDYRLSASASVFENRMTDWFSREIGGFALIIEYPFTVDIFKAGTPEYAQTTQVLGAELLAALRELEIELSAQLD